MLDIPIKGVVLFNWILFKETQALTEILKGVNGTGLGIHLIKGVT